MSELVSIGFLYIAQEDSSFDDEKTQSRKNIFKFGLSKHPEHRLYDYNRPANVVVPWIFIFVVSIRNFNNYTLSSLETEVKKRHKKELFRKQEIFRTNDNKFIYQTAIDVLDEKGVEYEIIDHTQIKPKMYKKKVNKSISLVNCSIEQLWNHQIVCIMLSKENDKYTFVCPAGTGKSLIGIGIINELKGKWLYITYGINNTKVITQILRNKGITVFNYKEELPENLPENYIIVSTYNSSKKFKNHDFYGIIYDECHRICITKKNILSDFQFAVRNMKCQKQFFLTATKKFINETKNKELISMHNDGYFGSCYELKLKRAIREGLIVDYRVLYHTKSLDNLLESIKKYKPFKSLIFCETINECNIVQKYLEESLDDTNVYVYHSKNNNRYILNNFKKYRKTIIVCCDMLTTGFDEPDITDIFHYSITLSYIQNTQRNGRGQRLSKMIQKSYCRLHYFITKSEDILKTMECLMKNDQRIKTQLIKICSGGCSHMFPELKIENGNEEKILTPNVLLKRDAIKIICNTKKTPLENLQKILRKQNSLCELKDVLYDRKQILEHEYVNIWNTITKKDVDDWVRFSMNDDTYYKYIGQFETDTKKIKKICMHFNIQTPKDYKNINHVKLPPYKFIINGGIKEIKNLQTFLSECFNGESEC